MIDLNNSKIKQAWKLVHSNLIVAKLKGRLIIDSLYLLFSLLILLPLMAIAATWGKNFSMQRRMWGCRSHQCCTATYAMIFYKNGKKNYTAILCDLEFGAAALMVTVFCSCAIVFCFHFGLWFVNIATNWKNGGTVEHSTVKQCPSWMCSTWQTTQHSGIAPDQPAMPHRMRMNLATNGLAWLACNPQGC